MIESKTTRANLPNLISKPVNENNLEKKKKIIENQATIGIFRLIIFIQAFCYFELLKFTAYKFVAYFWL